MIGKGILKKYLKSIGSKDYTDLTPEEQATYKEWIDIFEKEITPNDLERFLKAELKNVTEEMRENVKEGKNREALLNASKLDVYDRIINFVNEPDRQRKSIENHIKGMIKE